MKLKKLRREISGALSKLCLKSTKVDFMGSKYPVPLIHGIGANHHLIENDLMYKSLEFFLQNKDGAVIDVGVNIGLYLLKLKSLDSDREYFGFEPNSLCNYYVQEMVRLNHFRNVQILPFALSGAQELKRFYAGRRADKMGSLNKFVREGGKRRMDFSFDLITFVGDELLELLGVDNISVIKIDVEGSELSVLQGIKKKITKCTPHLYIEVWPLPKKDDPKYLQIHRNRCLVFDFFKNLDYRIFSVLPPGSMAEICSLEEFIEDPSNDCVFIHSSNANEMRRSFCPNEQNIVSPKNMLPGI